MSLKTILENNKKVDCKTYELSKLKSNFPQYFDKNGKFDFDKFKNALDCENVEYSDEPFSTKESYSLNFVGKKFAQIQCGQDTTTVITPDLEHNNKPENINSENIYIKGDNLDAIKHLLKSYKNAIKCIYIDPPYNTGSDDFAYPDNFKYDVSTLEKMGLSHEEAERVERLYGKSTHSAWLTFMLPRLMLARELLSEDGVIFISIDDNEASNLKILCDKEIFGEDNCIIPFYIQVRYEDKDLAETKPFKPVVEHVLAYAKNSDKFFPKRPTVEYTKNSFIYEICELAEPEKYNLDGQEVHLYKPGTWKIKTHSEGSEKYLKETWISGSIYSKMSYGQVVKKYIEPRFKTDGIGCLYKVIGRGDDGLGFRYYTGPQKSSSTRCKMYSGMPLDRIEEIHNGRSVRFLPITNFTDYAPDFGNIVNEGGVKYNSGKKPIKLLKNIINMANLKNNDIVLDFFSGSASTAHAVMQLNTLENENIEIKYIMVQIPEKTYILDKNGNEIPKKNAIDAFNAGYKTISDIGIARIKNVINDLIKKDASLNIGFKIYELNTPSNYALDKIESFDESLNQLYPADFRDYFRFNHINGEDTILQTWKVQDGYGFTAKHGEIYLNDMLAYSVEKTLYLINPSENDFIKPLIEKFETELSKINKIVVFGYSYTFTQMQSLDVNIKNYNDAIKDVKTAITIEVRY